MLFDRNYIVLITPPDGVSVVVTRPISVKFSITRNTLSSTNKCTLEIKNLGEKNRSRVYKDRYIINTYWSLKIFAGYETEEVVFQGNINECYSVKDGVNWTTKIDAFDGLYGVQNGFSSQTFQKGTSKQTIIQNAIKDMPNIIQGVMGTPTEGTASTRGSVSFGKSSDILKEQTGGKYFIDNEVINIIDDDEYIITETVLITSDILLTSPKRRDTLLECSLLFFPQAKIGVLVNLVSLILEYNGLYKIMGFKHDVEISEGSSGKATTQISLYAGTGSLRSAT